MSVKITQLSLLIQEVSQLDDAVQAVHLVVARVREIMAIPVCSLYLLQESNDALILAATEGLKKSAVGKVSLAKGEGLVGSVAATLHVLNIADAPGHEKFKFFPELGELPYTRFLGVPLIHLRRLVGVLVVQDDGGDVFAREDEALLVTIAAHLAATLAMIQQDNWWLPKSRTETFKRHTGVKGGGGVGVGELVLITQMERLLCEEELCNESQEVQRRRFNDAIHDLRLELEQGGVHFDKDLASDITALFSVYRMMLDSAEFLGAIRARIDAGVVPNQAVRQITDELAATFNQAEDPYLRARGEDVLHLGRRILHYLCGGQSKIDVTNLGSELVLAGELISVADLSQFPLERIKGIVCTSGSTLSHTAIVASALGIPAVMGLTSLEPRRHSGEMLIVDGDRGVCITRPPEAMINEYRRLLAQLAVLDQGLALLKDEQAVTKDGFRVKLLANTGLLADVTPGLRNGAEGVGLYRSEIPFMVRENLPTEEEQLEVYAEVLQSYGDKPVCMRLLDIGGDKPLPYFSIHEDNPYLGWRGIRFTLDNTSIMIIQLRAMIRASLGRSNLRLLIPMVSRIDEVVEVRQLIEQVVEELCAEGYPAQIPLLGIMVEVPSAMLLIPQLADIVDFVSIGTNDLTQYLLAVDRNNPRVSKLFDNLHPAVLLAMKLIREHCRQAELSVSVCGEMASDPAAVLVLLALGYDRLSLNAHNIPRIKWLIRAVNRQDLMPLLESIKPLKNEQDIRALLDAKLHQLGWYRSVYHAFNG